jgi:hypothetical protein
MGRYVDLKARSADPWAASINQSLLPCKRRPLSTPIQAHYGHYINLPRSARVRPHQPPKRQSRRRSAPSQQQSWACTPSCAGRTAVSGRPNSTPARSRPPLPPRTTCSASSLPPRPLPTPPPASSPPSPWSPPTPPSSRCGRPPSPPSQPPTVPTLSRVYYRCDAMRCKPVVL